MRLLMQTLITLASCLALAGLAAANEPGSYEGVYYGPANSIGNGFGNAWVRLNDDGQPVAYGLRLTAGALQGLPDEDTALDLPLPPAAAATGIDHIGLNWNPHGHYPEQIYGAPHFDVHFFLMTQQQLQQITMRGDDVNRVYAKPAAEEIPTGYISPPDTGVPCMGCHWVDSKAPELNGQPFTATLIYGFYDGHVNFIEPMMTKEFLDSKPDFTVPIIQPQKFAASGYYPTRVTVKYDAERDEYLVTLDGLQKH